MIADCSDAWLRETRGGDSQSDEDEVEVFKVIEIAVIN
jgi:hypothetical protein